MLEWKNTSHARTDQQTMRLVNFFESRPAINVIYLVPFSKVAVADVVYRL
jgi:hypothetical protein